MHTGFYSGWNLLWARPVLHHLHKVNAVMSTSQTPKITFLILSHLYTQAWAHYSGPHTRTSPSLSHFSHSSENDHHYHHNHLSLSSSLTTSLHAALISCPYLLRSTDIFLVSVYNMFVEYHYFHNLKVLRLFIYVCRDYLSGRISSSRDSDDIPIVFSRLPQCSSQWTRVPAYYTILTPPTSPSYHHPNLDYKPHEYKELTKFIPKLSLFMSHF